MRYGLSVSGTDCGLMSPGMVTFIGRFSRLGGKCLCVSLLRSLQIVASAHIVLLVLRGFSTIEVNVSQRIQGRRPGWIEADGLLQQPFCRREVAHQAIGFSQAGQPFGS